MPLRYWMFLSGYLQCSVIFTAFLFLASLVSFSAEAASCKSDGGLLFLGTNRLDNRSIWISGTSAGDFRLDAAQGNQTVDSWSRSTRGLHLSTSPVVSSGNGGTHKLYEVEGSKDCLIDTQNQKRDFQLPDNIKPPSLITPPIGHVFPDFARPLPPAIALRPGGILPGAPGGPSTVVPPIGTLPPQGLTPGYPAGVVPPIGTLPPGGNLPTQPGGVTPPIGTLPPQGLTPGYPAGVVPPIGTLSPEGVMPTRPGTVTPPIGTLPPTGVTPGVPTVPGTPGGVTPPIGTLPPGHGRPSRPGVPDHYVVVTQGNGQVVGYCVDPRAAQERQGDADWPFCTREQLLAAGAQQELDAVPITEGRDLIEPTRWNAWSQVSGTVISDERYGRDFKTISGTAAFGADRKISDTLVAGFSVTFESTDTDGFNSTLEIDTQGFEIGPYVAMRLSQHWAVDGSLSYGFSTSQSGLAVLSGDYTSHEFGGSASLTGQYTMNSVHIRPKLSLTFNRVFSSDYDLSGKILNRAISVPISGSAVSLGTLDLSTEFSRQFDLGNGRKILPFVEVGAVYEYLRSNDGKILDGNLNQVTPSAWSYTVRAGATALLGENLTLDGQAGYLSLGQNGLDTWEGQLRLAWGF